MKVKKIFDNEIIKMYQSGLSCRVIGKKFGFSSGTILNRLKKNNIARRSHEEAARKHFFNEDFFTEIDTEAKAYFLGFIIADGSVDEKRRRLSIGINEKDEEILFRFVKEIEADSKIITKKTMLNKNLTLSKMIFLQLVSRKLIEDLINLGIRQNKTFTVKCPEVQEDMKSHLWRGIFDGDGHVSFREIKDGHLPILTCGICGSIFLMNDFSQLLTNLNIKHKISKSSSIYNIALYGENGLKFLNYVYKDATIFLERKKDKFDFLLKEKENQIKRKPFGIYKTKKNFYKSYSLKRICGQQKYLGTFKTLEEAIEIQRKSYAGLI